MELESNNFGAKDFAKRGSSNFVASLAVLFFSFCDQSLNTQHDA